MSFRAIVLPGDEPPRRSRIKRLLLFSDSVALIHPTDKAVVNSGEISERFPKMTVTWAERGPFPKSDDYDKVMELILADHPTSTGGSNCCSQAVWLFRR